MKQSTLAFGLFYTLMNVGFAIGAEIADYFRDLYGDGGGTELLGIEFTTYQIIILVGFVLNIPDFIAIIIMRDGAGNVREWFDYSGREGSRIQDWRSWLRQGQTK